MKKAVAVLAVLLLGVVSAALASDDLNFIVTLERSDLQQRVERLFPVVHEDALVRLQLTHPEVVLRSGSDRIGLGLRVKADLAGQPLIGRAQVDGKLRYLKQSGEFYLDDPLIRELHVNGLEPAYRDLLLVAAQTGLQELLRLRPVYVLGQMGEPKRIMGSELKSVTVEDGQLLLELDMF